MAESVIVDKGRGHVRVAVVCHMHESLVPVEIVFRDGELSAQFDGIWTDGEFDDSDECQSPEAFLEAYGDECWADVEAHRGGPTLSLKALCTQAMAAAHADG